MFQEQMKRLAVVMVAQMAELMQEDIVPEGSWETHDIEVQIDVVTCGAASPVGGIMLDSHAVVCEPVACGEFCKTAREFGLCLAAHRFDLLRICLGYLLVAFLLTRDCLNDPLSFQHKEGLSSRIWYKIRHRDTDTF